MTGPARLPRRNKSINFWKAALAEDFQTIELHVRSGPSACLQVESPSKHSVRAELADSAGYLTSAACWLRAFFSWVGSSPTTSAP